MARIAGVNVPDNKHTEIALTAIYGIGRNTAKKICAAAGVESKIKLKDLNESDVEKLRDQLNNFIVVYVYYDFLAYIYELYIKKSYI